MRPPYSAVLLDRAQEALELDASATVLDLAAGTGALTRELDGRFARRGRGRAGRARCARCTARRSRAARRRSRSEDESVDAVFVGEAFHWFDTAAAIAEIARVLRPRGGLAIIVDALVGDRAAAARARARAAPRAVRALRGPAQPAWDDRFDGSPFEPLHVRAARARRSSSSPTSCSSSTRRRARSPRFPRDEREAIFAAVRPLLAGPYRLPLKHELTWTRLA